MSGRRSLPVLLAAAAAALAVAAPAQAGWLPAQGVDGPSADILGLGGLDMSQDGGGTVDYLKRDITGVRVFASRLDKGRPRPAVLVDSGQTGISSEARVAVGNDNRALAVWINGGALWASLRQGAKTPWSAPVKIFGDAVNQVTNPSLDMSLLGTGYVSFNVGNDVRVARMPYQTGQWTVLPQPIDIDPSRTASQADLAAAADGSAIVAWTEAGADGLTHVFERRITDDGAPSSAPREASVRLFQGRPAGNADTPSVSITNDSSYVFVAFREDFTDAGSTVVSRGLARRLVASQFEGPHAIDALNFPTGDGAATPVVAVGGDGYGAAATGLRSGGMAGAGIGQTGYLEARWFRPVTLGSSGTGTAPLFTTVSAEGERGVVAWQQGASATATLQARSWNGKSFEAPITLTNGSLGPSNAQFGIDSGADSRTEFIVGFVQGNLGSLRIGVVAYDGILRPAAILNARERWRNKTRPLMRWRPLSNVVWGPVSYRVVMDRKTLATTRKTSYRPPKALPQGKHVVEIVQIDGRGQESPGLDRPLWIDNSRPLITLRRAHRGFRVSANDGSSARGSGVASLRVVFARSIATVRVPASGRVNGAFVRGRGKPVRIVSTDNAGNGGVVSAQAALRPGGAR